MLLFFSQIFTETPAAGSQRQKSMLRFFRSDTPSQQSDEELLARYQAGGEARYLGQLYERYMPMVYGVCVKILRDPGKAEDAVMNIYEELTRKAKEHQVESFRGWLYVLARNHCLMEWRKNHRRPTDYHAPEDMVHYDAVEAAFEVELPAAADKSLEKCLGELPQQQRQSVVMFYFEEKTYKEIAELIAEEVGKVRSYIQNGRRNLKICLEKTSTKLKI
jgi:RNA polymerase sigma factor (sigma-70 family)